MHHGRTISGMSSSRICLGYDLRLSIRDDLQPFPPGIQDQMLLPRSALISADPAVWLRAPDIDDLLNNSDPNNIDEVEVNPLGLARDIGALVEYCKVHRISTDESTPVALTCFEEVVVALEELYGKSYFRPVTSEAELKERGWNLAGFDALEIRGLTSGLSGCGYKDEEKRQLQAYFGGALNSVGLFRTSAWAARFGSVRGLRIHAHAPFIPVGVWVKCVR